MPVKVTKLSQPDPGIMYYDPRQHPIDENDQNTKVGYNGHVVLLLDGANLTVEYHDILQNNLLLTESFVSNGDGTLQHLPSKPPGSELLSGLQTN